ncbi:tyrosine-type recombinase/integrase [Microbacterium suwonense]|uniref:Site-specific integrase n=1 Tax=Microbacterium suwonense TaxID=683047 RepID=A0ABN6X586_9MICO|nr:tyrosine-type recombinase/integrase [Microbacterium suwonense]BDZ39360.1 site-specific integrase [Microbacterium suwonense]
MGSIEPYETTSGRRYRIRYRTPENRQTDKRGFRTKREAAEYLTSVETQKSQGDYIAPSRSRIDVNTWAIAWQQTLAHLKPTTRSGYIYSLNRHVLPRWGRIHLADISHTDLQVWAGELSETLAASSARQVFHVMNSMLTLAVRDRRLTRNPSADVKLPKVTKSKRGYLDHAQVRELVRAAGPDGDIIATLAYTGLRWGELAALTVDSVDLRRKRLSITQSVSEVGGALVWGTPKTNRSRVVGFPAFLTESIQARMSGKQPTDQVFTSHNGAVLRNNNFRRRSFAPALEHVREMDPTFPEITLHDLRHTAASLAVSAGANVKAVQRMLGHASAAMTLDVYADLFDDDLNAVSTALDRDASAHFGDGSWTRQEPTQTGLR